MSEAAKNITPRSDHFLDLRAVQCPINFVRTKLKLETIKVGETLEVILDDGEPIESVSQSILEEGQKIISKKQMLERAWTLLILKLK